MVVYSDKFDGGKAVSAVLCGWGFCSYVYGLYVKSRQGEKVQEDVNGVIKDGDYSNKHHDHQGLEMSEVVVTS